MQRPFELFLFSRHQKGISSQLTTYILAASLCFVRPPAESEFLLSQPKSQKPGCLFDFSKKGFVPTPISRVTTYICCTSTLSSRSEATRDILSIARVPFSLSKKVQAQVEQRDQVARYKPGDHGTVRAALFCFYKGVSYLQQVGIHTGWGVLSVSCGALVLELLAFPEAQKSELTSSARGK